MGIQSAMIKRMHGCTWNGWVLMVMTHDSWMDCGEQKSKLLKANYSGSKACHNGQNYH
mgnify:CR=1 FL=1